MLSHRKSQNQVTLTSPRYGYYSHDKKIIYIPVKEKIYNSHATFDIKRTSGRYHSNQVKEQVQTLPTDAIPVDFYEQPESIFFKFALPSPPSINQPSLDQQKW
jgi:hypothetical protein